MPHRPRAERDLERARAAAARAIDGSATNREMDRAMAQIGAAFGNAAAINAFKLRVERWLEFGPQHPAVRARFGARAEMIAGCSLDVAAARVERWRHTEQRAFAIASALGYGNRLSLDVLRELRLILRLMRFKRMQREFGAIVTALRNDVFAEAAE
jgi:hypothetical protein